MLSSKLQLIELQLAPNNMSGLKHLVSSLTAAIEMQVRCRTSACA
jgi:hypothetical protein